jgi:hypothetical protein
MNSFVVYAFCRENGTFYYIGKGRPKRPYESRKEGIKPPKDQSRILILHENLAEKVAFQYEKDLIAFYGRKDKNEGGLYNMTDGGEGVSGWVPSPDWCENKSQQMSGDSNPFYGKTHSEETRLKISNARKRKMTGQDNHMFGVRLCGAANPMYGRKRPDLAKRNSMSCPVRGTKWFNNSEIDKRFHPENVPNGFVPGRLKVGKGHKRPDLAERNRNRRKNSQTE